MSKMKSWNDEPAIQQKEYSQEKYNKKKKKLKHGDIVITISDGILDVDKNNIGDYSWLRTYLEKATTNPDQLSRDILDKAKELSNGKVMDDMTVVVSKLYSLY